MQARIEENTAGFRKQPGAALKNSQTGEVIYIPPQHPDEIIALMTNLESFINDEIPCDWDSLVKMAIIHHQFESIHPFYDGNGRTGRMINVLYLVKEGLLTMPVLYLSRYINQHKSDYYRLLQEVRTKSAWEEWVLFMLDGVEQTSKQTIALVHAMVNLMLNYKKKMRSKLPKVYSQDLINNIFRYPYTKIDFLIKDLKVSRITATRYLNELVRIELMMKQKPGRDSYYINTELYALLGNFHQTPDKT